MDAWVTFLVGFGGVIVGALLTGVIELWRQVLEGRSAARIIRMEIQENVNRAVLAVGHEVSEISMKADAWEQLRVRLAPLLPESVLHHLAMGYGAAFIVERWLSQVRLRRADAEAQVTQWADDMMLDTGFLLQLERRSRFAQLADLMLGNPTFPTPKRGEKDARSELADRKQRLFELMDSERRSQSQP